MHAVGIGIAEQSTSFEETVNESKMASSGPWVRDLLRIGEYPNQLQRLFSHFPKEQVTVINFSELVDTQKRPNVLTNLLQWVGVETVQEKFAKVNDAALYSRKRLAKSESVSAVAREQLIDYYRDSVKRTEEILGRKLDWGFD